MKRSSVKNMQKLGNWEICDGNAVYDPSELYWKLQISIKNEISFVIILIAPSRRTEFGHTELLFPWVPIAHLQTELRANRQCLSY